MALALTTAAFAAWCVALIIGVFGLRGDLEARVGLLIAVDEARSDLEAGRDPADLPALLDAVRATAEPALVASADPAASVDDDRRQAALTGLVKALRGSSRTISVRLGDYWTGMYALALAAIVLSGANLGLVLWGRSRELQLRAARRKLERSNQELLRSNDDLDRFAYVASHDLQEPLRTITLYVELLRERLGDSLDGEAETWIRFVVGASARLRALINALLAFARVGQSGEAVEAVDAEAALAEVIEQLSASIEAAGASVEAGPLPPVMVARRELMQVLQHLIENAIKYRGEAPPAVRVGALAEGSMVRFRVADNGLGVEAQYQSQIFEMFQRLHNQDDYPGTGLGLALAKRIVESAGGRIRVESAPGEGSTFSFTLPAA